jgi:hypothetical protein
MRIVKKIQLIVENGGDGKLWGRTMHEDNLVTSTAANLQALEKKIKKVLKDFHNLSSVEFEYAYDVSAFFDNFDFLNQTKIAELSGINPGLLRQYASGVKYPSSTQAKKIEAAIHKLAKELESVSLYAA